MEEYARIIIEDTLRKSVTAIKRFPTGLTHYVFDVVTKENVPYVVRIARPERRFEFERGIYWQERLESIGIPLPKIYHKGIVNNHPYAVYERVPGSDLENVYSSLSTQEKRDIANTVAELQQKVHLLGRQHFDNIDCWVDVIYAIVKRTEREILATGAGNNQKQYIDRVYQKIQENMSYFSTVEPVAFLYDLNVRNVIVKDSEVTGIIDVDALWFGDPLLAIGRGKTILLTMQQDTDFISHWCQYLNLSDFQLKIVDFYALLYSVRFMGTVGQKLNGNYSLQTDPNSAHLLSKIADDILARVELASGN